MSIRNGKLFQYDKKLGNLVAGVDEVGRGALAGPLVSAAVLFDYNTFDQNRLLGLNDSKQVSRIKREALYPIIFEVAKKVSIIEISVEEINNLGIHKSNLLANHRALTQMYEKGIVMLADGFQLQQIQKQNVQKVIKGDATSAAIAAASIVAKVYRGKIMQNLHESFPYYGWDHNDGYGTVEHRNGISLHGVTEYHRTNFKCFRPTLFD